MGLLENDALVKNPALVLYPDESHWHTWLKSLNDQRLAVPIISNSPGSLTIPTGHFSIMARRLILTGTQRLTLVGTARLVLL